MSGTIIGLKRAGEVLVCGLILTFALVLVMPSSILAIGPMGDPEPAPPIAIPRSGDDPSPDPEEEDECVNPFLLAIGPMGDPEPAPPIATPWPKDDPPTTPRGRKYSS